MEQVGLEPSATTGTVDTPDQGEAERDRAEHTYDFQEYDLKEYDGGQFDNKQYEFGPYDEFGISEAKPTAPVYDDEFGPGVPAEIGVTETKVSADRCRGLHSSPCHMAGHMLHRFACWDALFDGFFLSIDTVWERPEMPVLSSYT